MNTEKVSKQEIFVAEIIKKLSHSRDNITSQWTNPVGTKTRYFFLDDLLPKANVVKFALVS